MNNNQKDAPVRRAPGTGHKYEWLRRSRTLLIDAYWPPLNPRLDFDAKMLADVCGKMHADTVRFGAAGKYGLIQNDIFPRHPELGNRDLLRETIDHLSPQGVRVVGYVPVSHGLPRSLLEKQRPQWALRLDDGSLPQGVKHFGGELLTPCCPFGQYRTDILAFIERVVEDYDIAGLYLDGPYYNWSMSGPLDICQCEHCRRSHLAATGLPLPKNRDILKPEEPETSRRLTIFRDWVGEGMLALLRDINRIAKRRDLPLLFNAFASSSRPPRYELAMRAEADGFLLESELGGLKGLGIGSYEDKVIWRYTQPHLAWPRLSTPRIEQENALCGWETVLWGGAPIISYAGRYHYGCDNAAPMAEVFHFLERNAETLRGSEPVRYAGIICLQRLGKTDALSRSSLEGSYLALQAEGVQVGIISREALHDAGELARYPVVLAPSLDDLTEAEAEALRDYVKSGGGLVATGSTATGSGSAVFRDLLGIGFDGIPPEIMTRADSLRFWEGDWDIYLKPEPGLAKDIDIGSTPSGLLPQHGFLPLVASAATTVLGVTVGGDNDEPLGAAIVEKRCGKGRALYVNFPLERVCRDTREPGLNRLLRVLVQRAAAALPPYAIRAEGTIQSALFDNGRGWLLHLLSPDPDLKEVTADVTVRLPVGVVVKSIRLLEAEKPVLFSNNRDAIEVKNIGLKRHECLFFELGTS
jgi:hypothetical protein